MSKKTPIRYLLNNYSIKSQLMISLMVIIIPFILMGIITYTYNIRIIVEKLSEDHLYVLDEKADNIDQLLSGIESRAEQIKYDNNIQLILSRDYTDNYEQLQTVTNAHKMMEKIVFACDDIVSIYIISNCYRLKYMLTTVGFLNIEDVKDYSWYNEINNENKSSIWIPVRLNDDNIAFNKEYVITYASPILQLNDLGVAGHIFITFKESSFHEILKNKDTQNAEEVYLLDNNGGVFYSSGRKYNQGKFDMARFSGKDINNNIKGFHVIDEGGNKFLITYTTLSKSGWKLVSKMPLSGISNKLLKMSRNIYAILFLCIPLSIFLAVILYKRITNPLHEFAIRMESIGQGDFSMQNYNVGTRNEIQKIFRNFDIMSKRILQLLKRNTHIMEQKKLAELKALQAQINPHFLYNTLDAINWLAMLNKQDDISKMVTNLSQFFRTILNEDRDMVTIEEEINHVRAFVEIERYRYKNRFEFVLNPDTRLYGFYTLKFILQPFVENALVHGFKETNGEGRICLQVFSEEDTIFFEIIDNGCGMSQERLKEILVVKNNGYGVINVNERIKLKFGKEYGLVIKSEKGGGTIVTITIPKIENDGPASREFINDKDDTLE